MRDSRFRPGDDAVSPVVGVVLLVGIAVMLMTVVAVFVLGYGPGEQAPESDVQFEQTPGGDVTITVTDSSGLIEEEVEVLVEGEPACTSSGRPWDGSGAIATGDTVTVTGFGPSCSPSPTNPMDTNQTVLVVWSPQGSGQTEVIGEFQTF